MFSGGIDSTSVGLAAAAAGRVVRAYTFVIDGQETIDLREARRISAEMGWDLTECQVKSETVKEDLDYLVALGCVKKTQFECTWPFLNVWPKIEEADVLSGLGADGHCGVSKTAHIRYRVRDSLENMKAFRAQHFAAPNIAGVVQQRKLAKENGKRFIAPYLEPAVADCFAEKSWIELNKPQQKYFICAAFPVEFKTIGRRDHANLQLVAGVPRIFEKLLGDPEVNRGARTRVLDLCRDLSRRKA